MSNLDNCQINGCHGYRVGAGGRSMKVNAWNYSFS